MEARMSRTGRSPSVMSSTGNGNFCKEVEKKRGRKGGREEGEKGKLGGRKGAKERNEFLS